MPRARHRHRRELHGGPGQDVRRVVELDARQRRADRPVAAGDDDLTGADGGRRVPGARRDHRGARRDPLGELVERLDRGRELVEARALPPLGVRAGHDAAAGDDDLAGLGARGGVADADLREVLRRQIVGAHQRQEVVHPREQDVEAERRLPTLDRDREAAPAREQVPRLVVGARAPSLDGQLPLLAALRELRAVDAGAAARDVLHELLDRPLEPVAGEHEAQKPDVLVGVRVAGRRVEVHLDRGRRCLVSGVAGGAAEEQPRRHRQSVELHGAHHQVTVVR